MSTRRRREHRTPLAATPEGPSRPAAKRTFAPAHNLAVRLPKPNEEEAALYHAPEIDVEPAFLPAGLRRAMGIGGLPKLSEPLRAAAAESGHKSAAPRLHRAVRRAIDAEKAQEHVSKAPELGSVTFTEPRLRKVFANFDLDKNDVVGAKELKNLFAQLGEMPTDAQIDGMIRLMDHSGDGVVKFEDFWPMFMYPAESLRKVNVDALKEVVLRDVKNGSDDEGDAEAGSSGSSLEPREH